VDGKLPLVGGVEWDFADLGVLGSDSFDGAHHHLAALEESRFGGITGSFSLENWSSLASKEDGSVAKGGNSSKVSPGGIVLVGDVASGLILSRVSFLDLVVEPHVSDGHSVLGKSTGLVRADGGGGTKGLNGFQVLDEAVLFGHALGGESKADSDSGEETFWDIGDNDTDQEDDSFEPVVAEDEGKDEEDNTEEDGNTSNDVDEMLDFLGNWRITRVDVGSEGGDSAHDSVVTASNDDTSGGTFDAVGREESKVTGFEDFNGGLFGVSGLWLGFTSQRRVVNLHRRGRDDSEISGDSVTTFDFDDVTENEFASGNSGFLAVSENESLLRDEILERFHDGIRFGFLVVLEDTSNDDDSGKDDTEVKVVFDGVLGVDALDRVSEEAKNGANPEKGRETTEEISAELNPLGSGFWRSQLVVAVPLEPLFDLSVAETSAQVEVVLTSELFSCDLMLVHLDLLTEIAIITLSHAVCFFKPISVRQSKSDSKMG